MSRLAIEARVAAATWPPAPNPIFDVSAH